MAEDETYRLTGPVRPKHYEIEVRPDLDEARFDGHVDIDLDVAEPVHEMVLNAAELSIDGVVFTDAGGSTHEPEFELNEENERLVIRLAQEWQGTGRLSIDFQGELNDRLIGFYRSTFQDQDGSEKVIATTQFESTHARRAFP
ncbi:MAG TPA: hypothetical protein VFH70_09275, partial [Acidimicrobiales bacterium]|nr:hypothetical protein [Acidimicrobiales bacterium]